MRIADFDIYRDILIQKSGLSLTQDKSYLLDSRLTPVARKWGFASLAAMTLSLRGVPEPALVKDIVEAMTTGETSFFRDGKPFELFRDTVLPALATRRHTNRALRIWCAGCSSGQEPYSLAITILENQHLVPGWNVEILATDISDAALEKAQAGAYTQFESQRGLPVNLLLKYFEQRGEKWGVNKNVRKMVTFRHFNMLDDMTPLGMFDVILCRNVLTYFDDETKKDVLGRIAQRLPSDGFLFLGAKETADGFGKDFKTLGNGGSLYVLNSGVYESAEASKVASQ